MPNFVQIFKERGNISFVGMRDTAISLLPMDRTRRNKLYDDLERGKGILDDDDHLNMYLHSFGKMHKAKARIWRSTACLVQMSFVKKLKSSIGDVDRELLQSACLIS